MKTHRAKKSLGQNFLKSESALREIIKAGEITGEDLILEIGPGKGVLTKKLLEKTEQVVAVEKDRSLCELLREKFSKEISEGKLILTEEDILDLEISEIFSDSPRKSSTEDFLCPSSPLLPRVHSRISPSISSKNILRNFNYKIIANIPYNITGAILKKFLTTDNQPERMVLLVQKEVAERIVARDGKENLLSISVKVYGEPKMIMKVPARYFSPAPKVDSAIISIKNISRRNFTKNKIDEEKFWEILRAGFAHKRKKLSSNLKNLKKISKPELNLILGNKRAEDLTLKDWIELCKS
jgi:16S rRNA (adenine1518-N6/adenine1519-N6)-dimethyltransferase